MRYRFLLLFFLFIVLTTTSMFAQKGKVIESLSIKSDLLNRSVNYSIYLPPDYDQSKRHYPIVYLLHGYTDDETGWIQFGEANRIADEEINAGNIPPMIIVMPDAEVTWYVNDEAGTNRYEDFFIQEFIPIIEKEYRVRSKKEFRGITGLSMGGYGSLIYAMKHPDLFVASAPLSAAIYLEKDVIAYDQKRWDEVEGPMYGKGKAGSARITAHWKANNPFYIAKKMGKENLAKVDYFIDCGDDDFLYKGNAMFHILLREMEVKHEYRTRDGGHTWPYWRTALPTVLKFIGDRFHR